MESFASATTSPLPPPSPSMGSSGLRHQGHEEKRIQVVMVDINVQIACFRDLLIHVGSSKDSSELRERIRRVRRLCVDACKQTNALLLPQVKSALCEGTILDSPQLLCLYMLSQLLERELDKCLRLVVAIPMDMTDFENKPTAMHGLGSVISQIVLCKTMKPDFNAEEKVSIEKDRREISALVAEMAEFLPREDPDKARNGLTNVECDRRKWIFRKRLTKQSKKRVTLVSTKKGTRSTVNNNEDENELRICCLCFRREESTVSQL